MPKTPRNMTRSFNNRTAGLFKKATELHQMMEELRISIVIERPGSSPLVFSTEESSNDWPVGMQNFMSTRGAVIKRPSHYTTLSESVSTGKAQIVSSLSSSPPCTPEPPLRSFDPTQVAIPDIVGLTQARNESCVTYEDVPHESLPLLSDQPSPYSTWEDWSQFGYQRAMSRSPNRPPVKPRLGVLPSKRDSIRHESMDSVCSG